MARVTTVKSARKPQGNCRRCGKAIEKGDTYRWFANRIGRSSVRKVFCAEHRPRPSEMTTSDKLATLYEAQENLDDQIMGLDPESTEYGDFEVMRDELEEAVRGVAEEYGESADNMEDGFGHSTYMSDEIREKADEVEGWADTIANVDFDEFEPEEFDPEEVDYSPDASDEAKAEELADAKAVHAEEQASAREDWFNEQVQKLEEVSGECPL